MKPAKEKTGSTKIYGSTSRIIRNMKTWEAEKTEYHLAPEWQSASPAARAALWIYTPQGPDDEVWTGVLDAAGTLQDLLLPVWALQFYGTAEAIREKKDAVLKTAGIVGDFPGLMTEINVSDRAVYALNLKHFAAHLELVASRLEDAEKKLRSDGWKFDPDTGKVSEAGVPHRPRNLLAECAWAIYREKYQDKRNTPHVRRKISRELSLYFEESNLSEADGAPIYSAIRNRERSLK